MSLDGTQLTPILDLLNVPTEFSRLGRDGDPIIISRLNEWKTTTSKALLDLRACIETNQNLPFDILVRTVAVTAVFDGSDSWLDDELRNNTNDVFQTLPPCSRAVVESVLKVHLKPIFLSSPHPSLNPETGRKASRAAGGPMAVNDYYEDQVWKHYPAAGNVLSWCIRHTSVDDYEYLWPLIIPPVMTFLDDYQAVYKLKGVKLVSEMLANVPKMLLKRTGVDQLLYTSLSITLSHLHDEHTPVLVRTTVPTILRLIELTTAPDSAERFDKQCALLGEKIIGGVWSYAAKDEDTIVASLDVIPMVLKSLGIGSIRYLKALVPQCLHCLGLTPETPVNPDMQSPALTLLGVVIDECQPRMHRWKGTIIEGVCKYWVNAVDSGTANTDKEICVRDVFRRLSNACPSIEKDEYARLLKEDVDMFGPILLVSVSAIVIE
ncbi:hypothetical protein BD410DRAFT_780065 [Rickenella mellea]|uniref:ARM repeat-containing protein n=1 Tax=Rickenella mellea TaxID=50990 RepID=A0A4R5XH93_9AGAM|nr:hypothetical protein BD410DRAFT_780065 [Rickenella mellea]